MLRECLGLGIGCGFIECKWKGIMWEIGIDLEGELRAEWKGGTNLSLFEVGWIHLWGKCSERTMGWDCGTNQRGFK